MRQIPFASWQHSVLHWILLTTGLILMTGCQITPQKHPPSRAEELQEYLAYTKGTLLADIPINNHSLVFYETADQYACHSTESFSTGITYAGVSQTKSSTSPHDTSIILDDVGALMGSQRLFCILLQDTILASHTMHIEIDFVDGTTQRVNAHSQPGIMILVAKSHGAPTMMRFTDQDQHVLMQIACQNSCTTWIPQN